MKQKALSILFAVATFCIRANASTVFNFNTDSVGTSTGFTDTVNGLSATFSSTADPGGFVVYQSMFETLTGNVLGDPGPAGLDNLSLAINFSSNLSGVTLDFATSDFITPSPLTLTAYENSTLVGSSSLTGNFLTGYTFPEGEISLVGGSFNKLVISSAATDFAVDNITVVATPEPSVAALLGAGLVVMGVPALRRRQARKTTHN